MKLNVKTVEKHTYTLKLSANEAEALLSDIVDMFCRVINTSDFRNGSEVNARFSALAELKIKLQSC